MIRLAALRALGWSSLYTLVIVAAAHGVTYEPNEVGRIVLKSNRYGAYQQYVPLSAQPPKDLTVVVHGTLGKDTDGLVSSRAFIERWVSAAEEHGSIILAPAFDNENFGGTSGPGGGYRGLWGRHIGADEFVNRIVLSYSRDLPGLDGKFRLYGHSAGGQFACRYVVRHPHRIRSAVICAPGEYAFPDPNVKWKYGMAAMSRRMRWTKGEPSKRVRVEPDPAGWKASSTLPIAVVVGARDDQPGNTIPGHPDGGRVTRARGWVRAMRTLAQENGLSPGVRLHVVPGVGHNSAELTPTSIRTLFSRSVQDDL